MTRTHQVAFGDRVGILSATLALDVTRAERLWAGSVFDMSSFGQQKLLDVMCHIQGQLQIQPHVSGLLEQRGEVILQVEALFSISPKPVV